MQEQTIQARIKRFIRHTFPLAESLNNDSSLLGNGLVDSMGILALVSFLEEEFHIALVDEEMIPEHFQSIESLASLVRSKQNRNAAQSEK